MKCKACNDWKLVVSLLTKKIELLDSHRIEDLANLKRIQDALDVAKADLEAVEDILK